MRDHVEDFAGDHALANRTRSFDSELMSATEILEEMRRMPETERRELAEKILEEFGDFEDGPTPEQLAEFERRAEELRRNPQNGIPWEQVRAELKERIKDRTCLAK